MRLRLMSCWLVLLWLCSTLAVQAASARILKVLPFYLDKEGRRSLSPSLYERDAYQAFLRKHPEKQSAFEFDINWKAKGHQKERLVLRMELRTGGRDPLQPLTIERTVQPRHFFSSWSRLPMPGQDFVEFGKITAWRASLWRGNELLAEEKSFLW